MLHRRSSRTQQVCTGGHEMRKCASAWTCSDKQPHPSALSEKQVRRAVNRCPTVRDGETWVEEMIADNPT
jgi:hypothetical protein